MSAEGTRVVLVAPRRGGENAEVGALSSALDEVARLGWTLIGVIDPADQLDALRLVLDGKADVILAARPEDLPVLQYAFNLSGDHRRTSRVPRPSSSTPIQPRAAGGATGGRRTERVERSTPYGTLSDRRTQVIRRPA